MSGHFSKPGSKTPLGYLAGYCLAMHRPFLVRFVQGSSEKGVPEPPHLSDTDKRKDNELVTFNRGVQGNNEPLLILLVREHFRSYGWPQTQGGGVNGSPS